MSYYSSYSLWIGLGVSVTVLSFILYCVRLKFIHRHVAPNPMQVVIVAHPNPHQLDYPQACWTVPIEQLPPPPYNAVVTGTQPYYSPACGNYVQP